MDTKTAYVHGLENGYSIAMSNQTDFVSLGSEEFLSLMLETESDTFRQYSPFEFLASELNRSKNSDSLWASYDRGVQIGIEKTITELERSRRAESSSKEDW